MKLKAFFIVLICVLTCGCATTATLIACAFEESRDPKPAVEYGEFDFYLEYKINSEQFMLSDSVLCNYEGTTCNGVGKRNKWSRKLRSGKEKLVIKKLSEKDYIISPLESCQDLMTGKIPGSLTNAVIEYSGRTYGGSGQLDAEKLISEYNIKLVKQYVQNKP